MKKKLLALGSAILGSATLANAAVTVDSSTGVMSGDIDLAPFFSGVAVILGALVAIWAVKKVIGLFR